VRPPPPVCVCADALCAGADAFQADAASARLAARPLNKASMHVLGLVNSLCVMLRSSPFHQEAYARLILGVLIQFYQRCFDRFQNLVVVQAGSRKALPAPVLAAQWAQRGEIAPDLADLLAALVRRVERMWMAGVDTWAPQDTNPHKVAELCRLETHAELAALGQDTIRKDQLLTPLKELAELCLLQRSVVRLHTLPVFFRER
jgi:exocyst complex component 4